jgi:hypothetical protein
MPAEMPPMDWYPPRWNAADIPPHLRQSGPPLEAPASSRPEPNDVFNRLKWSLLDPPSDAQVFGRDKEGVLQWQPLSEESNKTLLDETAMDPPQSLLEITIEPLQSWEHWGDLEGESQRPAQLLIKNADGQPISVQQFIQAVHGYALSLRNLLLLCMNVDPSDEQRARFFFEMIMGGYPGEISGQRGLAIYVVEDPEGDGEDCAWIWENMETRVKQCASQ